MLMLMLILILICNQLAWVKGNVDVDVVDVDAHDSIVGSGYDFWLFHCPSPQDFAAGELKKPTAMAHRVPPYRSRLEYHSPPNVLLPSHYPC